MTWQVVAKMEDLGVTLPLQELEKAATSLCKRLTLLFPNGSTATQYYGADVFNVLAISVTPVHFHSFGFLLAAALPEAIPNPQHLP